MSEVHGRMNVISMIALQPISSMAGSTHRLQLKVMKALQCQFWLCTSTARSYGSLKYSVCTSL